MTLFVCHFAPPCEFSEGIVSSPCASSFVICLLLLVLPFTFTEKSDCNITFGSRYSRMDQVKFVEDSLQKVLRGPFVNTLTHLLLR